MSAGKHNANLPKYNWIVREQDATGAEKRAESFAVELGITRLLARLLLARGIDTAEKAKIYLNPGVGGIFPPEAIPNLEKARDRILRAVEQKEPVMVHGDYDVDGISGAVILHSMLKELGCPSKIFLPKRSFHGFGLAREAVEKASGNGTKLIVTVDCGIGSHESVKLAREAGLDVIVTDHHAVPEVLPDATIVVHPDLDGGYPGGSIAGAMVGYKLAISLMEASGRDTEAFQKKFLPMAAMATIADVCPLTEENRSIVTMGLGGIPRSELPGLRILWEGTRRSGSTEPICARDIAFGMAPVMNAAGRMGDPYPAARLLMAADEETAWKYFRTLDRLNNERKRIQLETCRRLGGLPEVAWKGPESGILVLVDQDCLPGLAGLAAVRLAEETGRPTCILAPCEDESGPLYRGSMRTSGGENLLELMEPARGHTENMGGHAGAMGVTVRPEGLDEFLGVCRELEWSPKSRELVVDFILEAAPEDVARVKELDATRPWGEGNPQPVFVWRDITIKGTRAVGKTREHVQVTLQGTDGNITKGIGFSMARYFEDGNIAGSRGRAAGRFILNNWQGRTSVEFQLEDIDLY